MKKGAVYFFLFVLTAFTQIGCLSGYDFDPQNPPQEKLMGPITLGKSQQLHVQLFGSGTAPANFKVLGNYLELIVEGDPGHYTVYGVDGDEYVMTDNRPLLTFEIKPGTKGTTVYLDRGLHLWFCSEKKCSIDIQSLHNPRGKLRQVNLYLSWFDKWTELNKGPLPTLIKKTDPKSTKTLGMPRVRKGEEVQIGLVKELKPGAHQEVKMSTSSSSSSTTHNFEVRYSLRLIGNTSAATKVTLITYFKCGQRTPNWILTEVPANLGTQTLKVATNGFVCQGSPVKIWTKIRHSSHRGLGVLYLGRDQALKF
jgi:hypothetical protein